MPRAARPAPLFRDRRAPLSPEANAAQPGSQGCDSQQSPRDVLVYSVHSTQKRSALTAAGQDCRGRFGPPRSRSTWEAAPMLSPEPRETPSAPAHRRSPAPELPDPVFCWRGARAPARLSPGPRARARVCRAPLLPVLRSRFPQRRRPGVGHGEASGRGRAAPSVAACGEWVQFLPAGPSPAGWKPLAQRRGRCAARGIPGSSASPARGGSERSPEPGDRPALSSPPPGFSGAPGSRVPAAARGPELLRGPDPRSRPAPGRPCASPAPRAQLPGAAGRAAAPAREMQPLEAPSDADTGPPGLLAPPAAPAAARGPGDTKPGSFAVCPPSAGAALNYDSGSTARAPLL
ncbi:hypothetical protein R6Z07F_000005 [Ovis aries]